MAMTRRKIKILCSGGREETGEEQSRMEDSLDHARAAFGAVWLSFLSLHISPNHYLQSGIDDVIRRALDEGRVLLDGNRNRFLQFVLASYHFWRLVNDRHMFSPVLSVSVRPYWTRAKHMVNKESSCSRGWSDRHGSGGNEVGSLQPIPRVCPRPNGSSRHAQPLC